MLKDNYPLGNDIDTDGVNIISLKKIFIFSIVLRIFGSHAIHE